MARCPGAPTPPASPTGAGDRGEGGLGSVEAGRLLTCSCWAWSTDLSILLGMALGDQGLEECAVTGILREKLQYRNRLQYMVTSGHPPAQPLGSWDVGVCTFRVPPWTRVALSLQAPFSALFLYPLPLPPPPGLHTLSLSLLPALPGGLPHSH